MLSRQQMRKCRPGLTVTSRRWSFSNKLPAVIVPDNAAPATYRPKKHSTYRMVTDRYAAFADYYGLRSCRHALVNRVIKQQSNEP